MKGITIFAYAILTVSIGYAFIYSSASGISSLMEEKQKYDKSLEMVNNIESKKNELLAEFNNISAVQKKDIETVLPNSLNFVKLVSEIDAVAAGYGISINRISSKETSSSIGGSIEEAEPPRSYRSAIIGFSFNATYDKFNLFMGDLERSLRILDMRSVKLSPQENGIYSYDVELETYWLE